MSLKAWRSEDALVVFATLLFAHRTAHADDPYEEAMVRAATASSRSEHADAARALQPMVSAYPKDYAVAIECAWQHFQAEEWQASERAYREALVRAPASIDARVGLAWALARQRRCEAALAEAHSIDDPRTKDVLVACAPANRWALAASLLGIMTPSHPIKRGGAGLLASATGPINDSGAFGASWRFMRIATTPTSGVASFDENDWYFYVGYRGERYGIIVRGAVVADGSHLLKTSGHAGLSAYFRLGSVLPAWTGDARLESSTSIYDDGAIVRVAASWAMNISGPLHVIPGVATQYGGKQAYATGSLMALLEWPALAVWAGAKYGEEKRPAYLAQSVVYDIPELIAWGAWTGVRVQPWRALALEATCAFDELHSTPQLAPARNGMFALSVGPIVTF